MLMARWKDRRLVLAQWTGREQEQQRPVLKRLLAVPVARALQMRFAQVRCLQDAWIRLQEHEVQSTQKRDSALSLLFWPLFSRVRLGQL